MPLGSYFAQQDQRSSGPGFAGRLSGAKPAIPGNGPLEQRQFMQANPGFGNPYTANRAYGPAIAQQAGDYDEIMEGYRGMMAPGQDPYGDLISKYKNETGPGKDAAYTEAPEWAGAYGKASEYANTGGISEGEKGELRARGISPIRAVYANAQRGLDRQRSLSGGSANYNAAASKMARELSESTAGAVTNVNAGIAEMQQKGRLSALPTMTGMASGKNELMNQINMTNANNRAQNLSGYTTALNAQSNRRQNALEGMTSLYGTTPALVNTFGNQMNQQAQTHNQAALGSMQNRTNRGAAAGNIFSGLGGRR